MPSSKCLCPPATHTSAMPQPANPSGKCATCHTSLNRQGKILKNIPQILASISDVYKAPDNSISHHLSVLRVVGRFSSGIDHETEIKVSQRIYTQLKLERSPLVDPLVKIEEMPEEAYGKLYNILSEHLGTGFRLNVACPAFF